MKILKNLLKKFQSRDTRIAINAFHNLKISINNNEYLIKNISISGLGLYFSGLDTALNEGEKVKVNLEINEQQLQFTALVVYQSARHIGLSIVDNLVEYKSQVTRYFTAEINALNVRLMDPSSLSSKFNENTKWYYGDSNHELIIEATAKEVESFQIKYFNYLIQYSKNKITAEKCIEDDFNFTKHKKSTLLVPLTSKIPAEMVEIIKRFIWAIKGLDDFKKDKINSELAKIII